MKLNHIYEGDVLEVLKSLPDQAVHCVITSPPYNVGINYGLYADDMPLAEYLQWLEDVFTECIRVLCGGGHLCINIANTGWQPYTPLSHHLGVRLSSKIFMYFTPNFHRKVSNILNCHSKIRILKKFKFYRYFHI